MENKELTYISLFSCAGIGCLGFKKAGFKCIATNELIDRRLDVQRHNNKCERETGYIQGDITLQETKNKIFDEIDWWKKNKKINGVDIVVATPPCQGMSIFNHKKNDKDIERNSLVIESLNLVKMIQPKFFVFENVPAFMDTECIIKENERTSIREAHGIILGEDYVFYADTINFKLYGSNSSRTRTIVIGVRKDLIQFVSPVEMFPDRDKERTLREVIGDLPSLKEMGEILDEDIYHAFRTYPTYMREWIENLQEGQSAFDNEDPERRPYKIDKEGNRIANANKTGDKYKRQVWDKVALSVHTRNDQLASQNTIHPADDRVFSIRELMRMMTIPNDFRWVATPFDELNKMSKDEKRKFLKKEEPNIRKCIGEAVPTEIFYRIALKIMQFLNEKHYQDSYIRQIIKENELNIFENLLKYIEESKAKANEKDVSNSTVARIAELANNTRVENAAYYTGKDTLTEIFQHLPNIDKPNVKILEPAVGAGNFIPFLIKKYSYAENLIIDVMDIDDKALTVCRKLIELYKIPSNIEIRYINDNFLTHDFAQSKYDLIIGNPPYLKLSSGNEELKAYRKTIDNSEANNLAAFFVEKSVRLSDRVAFVLPKNFLCNEEYRITRERIAKENVSTIVDFGEYGFRGVHIETIFIQINAKKKPGDTFVKSLPKKLELKQKQQYIVDASLPNWVIYRDNSFDKVLDKKTFGVFSVFRDRQITKCSTSNDGIWVIKSRNIPRDAKKLEHCAGYDMYVEEEKVKECTAYKYLNRTDVFLVPNMTYYPRMMRKPKGVLTNGSVAILQLKPGNTITDIEIEYIASDEFEQFYRIARNHATRSLNIDNVSIYYFCINKKI